MRAAIRDGRLVAGDRLPSTRALAADLGLARGTVAEAYAQLTVEGYLTARPGAPTRVAFSGAAEGPPGRSRRASCRAWTSSRARRTSARSRAGRGCARCGRGFAAAPDSVLGYRDLRGRPELRAALAAYLGRSRGVLADPDRIVVCAGFNEGLALLLAALPGRLAGDGGPVPGLPPRDRARGGPRDRADGGRRARRRAAGRRDARTRTPRCSPPRTSSRSARRSPPSGGRRSCAGRASGGTVVIEDDYDGEFRYDRQPAGALQGLDPEHVVYAGTASKTLAPGLRLAWLVLPAALVEPVLEAKTRIGGTTVLEQLALAELISSGALDRHVRRMRARYRRRRDALLALLGDRRTRGIAAGLHLVVEVDDEAAVVAAGAREGVALQGLGRFWHDTGPPGLVIGYAAPPQHAYAAALEALGRALAADPRASVDLHNLRLCFSTLAARQPPAGATVGATVGVGSGGLGASASGRRGRPPARHQQPAAVRLRRRPSDRPRRVLRPALVLLRRLRRLVFATTVGHRRRGRRPRRGRHRRRRGVASACARAASSCAWACP